MIEALDSRAILSPLFSQALISRVESFRLASWAACRMGHQVIYLQAPPAPSESIDRLSAKDPHGCADSLLMQSA